jgi:hypothetical protein
MAEKFAILRVEAPRHLRASAWRKSNCRKMAKFKVKDRTLENRQGCAHSNEKCCFYAFIRMHFFVHVLQADDSARLKNAAIIRTERCKISSITLIVDASTFSSIIETSIFFFLRWGSELRSVDRAKFKVKDRTL